MRTAFGVVVAVLVATAQWTPAQEKVLPKVQVLVDELTKIIPAAEKAAVALARDIQPFLKSPAGKVAVAADSVALQIMAIRSIRRIIAEQPNFLIYHLGPTNIARWREAGDYFLTHARAGTDAFAGMVSGARPFRTKIDDQLLLSMAGIAVAYQPGRSRTFARSTASGAPPRNATRRASSRNMVCRGRFRTCSWNTPS